MSLLTEYAITKDYWSSILTATFTSTTPFGVYHIPASRITTSSRNHLSMEYATTSLPYVCQRPVGEARLIEVILGSGPPCALSLIFRHF